MQPWQKQLKHKFQTPSVLFFTPQTQEHYTTMTQAWMTSHRGQMMDVFIGFSLNQGYEQQQDTEWEPSAIELKLYLTRLTS